ncbi:MAG: hypothetical protein U9O95_03665 [Candidatus Marinimicrobia bacterium]|nr:hypothetical protein [Candidatus Neomarinimicrobiota bacterium]
MSEKKSKLNYRAFLIVGASFIGISIVFMLAVNTILGLALLAVGLGNIAIGLPVKGKK